MISKVYLQSFLYDTKIIYSFICKKYFSRLLKCPPNLFFFFFEFYIFARRIKLEILWIIMRSKNWAFSFLFSGTMLINLWLAISLYPNPAETENSKHKPCIDKCEKEAKQCTNLTNAQNEETLCFESWRSCIDKPLCKKERKQKEKSCLNKCDTESRLCETIAPTYYFEFECKKQKRKCQEACWKHGHQNRYIDHNDIDRRSIIELSVQDLWRFFWSVYYWLEAGNS